MKKEIIIKNKDIKTKLLIKSGYIQSYLNSLIKKENKIFCIIDQKLKKNKKINLIFIKGGEQIKTYKSYSMLCERLLSKKIDRDSVLVGKMFLLNFFLNLNLYHSYHRWNYQPEIIMLLVSI